MELFFIQFLVTCFKFQYFGTKFAPDLISVNTPGYLLDLGLRSAICNTCAYKQHVIIFWVSEHIRIEGNMLTDNARITEQNTHGKGLSQKCDEYMLLIIDYNGLFTTAEVYMKRKCTDIGLWTSHNSPNVRKICPAGNDRSGTSIQRKMWPKIQGSRAAAGRARID